MTRLISFLAIMVTVGAVMTASPTFAGPMSLPPGSTNVAMPTDTFAADVGTGYTVLDAYQSTVVNSADVSVTLYADAIRTSGGTVDMLYQITDNTGSPDSITSLGVSDYSNVPGVAVAGLSDTTAPALTNFMAPTGTPDQPSDATRTTSPGGLITFSFGSSPLGAGDTSAIILVQTSDTNYDKNGTVSAVSFSSVNGSVAFNAVPEVKTATVPEPSSLVLSGMALLIGAGVYGSRRFGRGTSIR